MDVALELTEPEKLAERLRNVLRGPAPGRVSVGVIVGEHASAIAVHDPEHPGEHARTTELPVGCVMKLFAAAMLWETAASGRCDLDGDLEEVGGGAFAHEAFRGVTLRHLLEHAHGLDDSTVTSMQRRADGFLKMDALCASLQSAPRLAEPGSLYSYGSSGAFLVAGILERLHGKPFAELLFAYLCAPRRQMHVCPATGGAFALSVESLLQFLAHQLRRGTGMLAADPDAIRRNTRALPGWHSTESGIYLGWKDYGSGWYGHNSEVPGAGLLVRLNSRERIGIVVSSGAHSPSAIAAALFRKNLPDLVRLAMPKLRKESRVGQQDVSRLGGTYANRAISVLISASGEGLLMLTIVDRSSGRKMLEGVRMHPAEQRIFFLQPPALEQFPFVQFVGESVSGYEYLWTGSQVLKRMQNPGATE